MTNDSLSQTHGSVEPDSKVMKIRVSLKGRPIRSYAFGKNVITIGRDPDSDVYLDNPGISRHHVRIEKEPQGFFAEDLGSANGTFLNDQQVHQRELLQDQDILRVGKFSLWLSLDEDRRGASDTKAISPTTFQGTTVLSTTELEGMMSKVREADEKAAPAMTQPHSYARTRSPHYGTVAVAVVFFLLGAAVGAWLFWVLGG
ncbi:MAG: FHA domain-containing protein [Candidatus Latescibacterota bacterium]|nr:MAG: FHA domain-containing protein [Candidatus Latescibacterota bacterium]